MRISKWMLFFLLIIFVAFIAPQTRENENKMSKPAIWPVKGMIEKKFGNYTDPDTGEKKFNSGINICTKDGEKVRAAADGLVKSIKNDNNGSYIVVIDHGSDYLTLYGNLMRVTVKENEYLKIGATIGFVGQTANGTAPFLYYEIQFENKPVDPLDYML